MHVLIQSLMLFFKSLMMTLWGRLTPASLFPHFTAFTAGNALKVLFEFLSSLRNKSRTWWRMSEYPTSEPVHSGYLQMTGSIFKHMLIKSEYSWKTHTQWKTCQLSLPAKKKRKEKKNKSLFLCRATTSKPAGKNLGLRLTSSGEQEGRPTAGVPFHLTHLYIILLIKSTANQQGFNKSSINYSEAPDVKQHEFNWFKKFICSYNDMNNSSVELCCCTMGSTSHISQQGQPCRSRFEPLLCG